MSSQPFGAAPPPADLRGPAQDATADADADAAAATRSPLVRYGLPAVAGLLLAAGLVAVLTGGQGSDDAGSGAGAPVTAATPAPSPSPSATQPQTLPVSSSRNPFDPLVQAASTGSGVDDGSGAVTGGGGSSDLGTSTTSSAGSGTASVAPTASTASTTSSGTTSSGTTSSGTTSSGTRSSGTTSSGTTSSGTTSSGTTSSGTPSSGTGSSGTSSPGTGSSAPSSTTPTTVPPSSGPSATAPAPGTLDAVATCQAGDVSWTTYRQVMKDTTTTHTMAGHRLGPVTTDVDALVEATSVEALRQPLRAWATATASVRTQLVTGAAVRDVQPADPLEDSTGGVPAAGTRPVVDQAALLLARTAVRERCYQLTDPLVPQGDL